MGHNVRTTTQQKTDKQKVRKTHEHETDQAFDRSLEHEGRRDPAREPEDHR